jgi:hypothetical protein
MQRTMQWGDDAWAHCFGVGCPSPVLYAYFVCSIRNRLEVWASERFRSPTAGSASGWRVDEPTGFSVKRPTKLLDGSRGGQAFMAALLAPEADKHYTIEEQARMQLLSVLLVGAGLTGDTLTSCYIDQVLPLDFAVSAQLGSVFYSLAIGLGVCSFICVALMVTSFYSIFNSNLYGSALPYVVKLLSLAHWAVGAIGLLMLGGNPRVKIVRKKLPAHVSDRIHALAGEESEKTLPHGAMITTVPTDGPKIESTKGRSILPFEPNAIDEGGHLAKDVSVLEVSEQQRPVDKAISIEKDSQSAIDTRRPFQPPRLKETRVRVQFGSQHGSIFTPDRGTCMLPLGLVEEVCSLDFRLVRSTLWYVGVLWFGLMLLAGIGLQIAGALAPAFGANLMSLVYLLVTSLLRGAGVSGSEEWMIPKWKRRKDAGYGAVLVGQLGSRMAGEDA